jgi:hypothetical protein
MHIVRTILVPFAVVTLVGCGVPATTRQAATSVVDELARGARARESAYEQLLRRILADHFRGLAKALDATWEARRAVLKLQTADRVLAKRQELTAMTRKEMDHALGPQLEQMSAALAQAKADVAAGKGGEDRKNELAAQLAATLAFVQKTVFELDEEIDAKLALVRADTMKRIDLEMTSNPSAFEPEAQVELVLKDLKGRVEADYLSAFDQGAAELRRYISLDTPPALVLKGLFGDGLGDRLFTSVQTFTDRKLAELVSAADQKASAILAEQDQKAAEAIGSLRK